jgi:hypothetical protein
LWKFCHNAPSLTTLHPEKSKLAPKTNKNIAKNNQQTPFAKRVEISEQPDKLTKALVLKVESQDTL